MIFVFKNIFLKSFIICSSHEDDAHPQAYDYTKIALVHLNDFLDQQKRTKRII